MVMFNWLFKLKNYLLKTPKSLTLKHTHLDGSSTEFILAASGIGESKKIEEDLQEFASKNIKTIGDLSPLETFSGLVAAAMYFFIIRKYIVATRYAEEALRLEPRDNNLRIWLVKVYGNYIGQTDPSAKHKALEICTEAIKRDPDNYDAHLCNAIYTSHVKGPNESIPLYLKTKKLMEDKKLTMLADYGKLCSFLGAEYLRPSNYRDTKQAEILYRQAILTLQSWSSVEDSKFWLNHTKKLLAGLLATH